MRYQVEFPDFPAADMPAVPEGWTDESWGNEGCPSFATHLEAGACSDFFLGSWHIDADSDARLRMCFIGGGVNQFHQCKATTSCGDDFETFAAHIDRALAVVAAGEAFDAEREAADIARRGCAVAEHWAAMRSSFAEARL